MSCASSVEIEDVLHKAHCRLHVPNSYGTECASYEKVQDFPLNSAAAFALSKTYGMSCTTCSELLRYGMCVLRENLRFPT